MVTVPAAGTSATAAASVTGTGGPSPPSSRSVRRALASPVNRRTRAPGGAADEAPGEDTPEPAQPVFTRYWLHGKGPAPAGNLPVAVHLSPGRIALAAPPDDPAGARLRLTVACGPEPARGEVGLDIPPGLLVVSADGGPRRPLRYELAGGGYADWDLCMQVLPGTPPGRHYLTARIQDDLGQILEDATLVTVGEPPSPPLDLPLADLLPLLEADQQAAAAEVGVRLGPAVIRLSAGQQGECHVVVTNRTAAPVRGECQLISPLGTWPVLKPWTRGFTAGPGETTRLCYPLHRPAGARPGSHWWALAKVMYFGRVVYSESVLIEAAG